MCVPGVLDGRQWLRQRQQHLQQALDADPSPDQRLVIEAELAKVRAELRRSAGWRHWLLWGFRRPGP
jgi:hypothetical protein